MASVTATLDTKRAVASVIAAPFEPRIITMQALDAIQYLPLKVPPDTGTTATDKSGNALNGVYTATSVPSMIGQIAGPFGGLVPEFDPANLAYINGFSAGLGAVANGAEGAAFICVKMDPAAWADGLQHWFWILRASATYYIALQKWSTNNQARLRYFANNVDLSISFSISTPLWFSIGMDWSQTDGTAKLYINGRQQGATGTLTQPWSGAITLERIGRDTGSGTLYHDGGLAELALFDAPLGASAHLALAGSLADRTLFLGYGDSKTEAEDYQHTTTGLLEGSAEQWDYRTIARSGYTVVTMQDEIDTDLAAYTSLAPRYVLSNLGANDVASMQTETTWKADYQYIFDAMRAKWPSTKIYLMRPWRRNYAANCDIIAGWIDDLVVANPGLCYLGPDERVFIENGDNGTTYTGDGIHPNTAGYALVGQQWYNVLTA